MRYPERPTPSPRSFQNLMERFDSTGSVEHSKREVVNRIATIDTTERDTKSSSAKTITIRSNGTANPNSETKADSETGEEEAATKIQAAFRGHKTRQSMKQPQAQPDQNKEPTREELENEFRLDDRELCHAATKIQATFRGHMSRKTVDEKTKGNEGSSKEEVDIDLTDPELNKAAGKIQASFRDHLNRKDHDDGNNSSK